jgi:hypothetical protein
VQAAVRDPRAGQSLERYSPELVEALGEVAQYLHDAFGKFPATIKPRSRDVSWT